MDKMIDRQYARHKCIVCDKPIGWTFAIHSNCETTYGNTAANWPKWLRFLWADEQRLRRVNIRIKKYEVQYDEEPH